MQTSIEVLILNYKENIGFACIYLFFRFMKADFESESEFKQHLASTYKDKRNSVLELAGRWHADTKNNHQWWVHPGCTRTGCYPALIIFWLTGKRKYNGG